MNNENLFTSYGTAALVFLGLLLIFTAVRYFIIRKLVKIAKKTNTDIDDLIVAILLTIKQPLYWYLAFFIASRLVLLPPFVSQLLYIVLVIVIAYIAILIGKLLIRYFLEKIIAKEKDEGTKAAYHTITTLSETALWILGGLLVLSNLGINITSLVAGLGIGGIAIALALQNILGDLFSSFAIYFDKPFVVGDFIIVGDKMGVVEKIGIKTTRIRALQGEEIILSNQQLTSAQVQNFKRMKKRRVVFSLGVTYDTPQRKLKEIPSMIQKIIEQQQQTVFDRAHFSQFDASALTFEIVYNVTTGDYNVYMDIQQEINLAIKDKFEEKKIEMAYPTQTIYLQK